MKLLEYEAKSILDRYQLPVPEGQIVDTDYTPKLPIVLKAQVPVGGRGKAGGIKFVHTKQEYDTSIEQISNITISGHTPSAIYAEQPLDIDREIYLSLIINRDIGAIELMAHPDGGIDIEQQDTERFYKKAITIADIDEIIQPLADHLDIPEAYLALGDMIENLYKCFVDQDALLIEINPLVLTRNGRLMAADCKMELDDAASYRHPEWNFVDNVADTNFVTLDTGGTVATMANGAGLAMATVDAVVAAGYRPANFLDIGGTATVASVTESFQRIGSFANVQTIIINIFGGIVRCDTVAEAIIAARESLPAGITLAVRLSGNRAEQADALLSQHGITHHQSLEAILQELPS